MFDKAWNDWQLQLLHRSGITISLSLALDHFIFEVGGVVQLRKKILAQQKYV